MAQEKPRKDPHLPPLSQMRRERGIGPTYMAPRGPNVTGNLVSHGDLDAMLANQKKRAMIEDFIRENGAKYRSELEAFRLKQQGISTTPDEIRTLRRAFGWDH